MSVVCNSLTVDSRLLAAGKPAESLAALWEAIWTQSYLTAEELELCRLNLARLHGLEIEWKVANTRAPAIAPERQQSVIQGTALSDAAFSSREKALLLFAEYYWIDTQSITDEVADEVKAHIGEAGLVLLIEALGCMDTRIRAAACLRDLAVTPVEDGIMFSGKGAQ